MIVLVVNEAGTDESRVAATPETVKHMVTSGLEVQVEAGAGAAAFYPDAEYESVGASLVAGSDEAKGKADVVLKVGRLDPDAAASLKSGAVVIGFLDPFFELESVRRLAEGGVTSLPVEFVPRITRAQSMDALSSQASVAGYKAVLIAASRLPRYFPLLMTAAGTIRPARVIVMGAGVAGLQAIATARRLGALVEVSDIRPEVEEQVESLGGRFIELPEMETGEGGGGYAREMGEEFLRRQREILAEHVATANVVITTAAVPGKRAPRLLSADMVRSMHPGGVVVDLAAERGGNCELTRAGEEVVEAGVTILGPLNVAGSMPHDSSALYARNVEALLKELLVDGALTVDLDNDVVGPTLLTHGGEVVHELVKSKLEEAS